MNSGSNCRLRLRHGRTIFRAIQGFPGLTAGSTSDLQVTRDYLQIAFDRIPIGADKRGKITRLVQKRISFPARWRLDHDMYRLPVELWLNNQAQTLYGDETSRGCEAAGANSGRGGLLGK